MISSTILLIGHRGAGKSTLGDRLAARYGLPFTDLDDELERRHGKPAAELVKENTALFRKREASALSEILAGASPRVIAVGGGLEYFPAGVLTIWLDRQGWEEIAASAREKLRAELSMDEEIAWMRDTRERRYAAAAHVRLAIERDHTVEEASDRLAVLAGWLSEAIGSAALAKTWIVPQSGEDVGRCAADAGLFKLAGVELRSDLIALDIAAAPLAVPVLASLRGDDAGFFASMAHAAAFDFDYRFADAAVLGSLPPRMLIISAHPQDVDKQTFDAMLDCGRHIAEQFPDWEPHIRYKYAPRVKSWVEMRFAHDLARSFQGRGGRVSLLPVGKQWHWMRALRLRSKNELNYILPGCSENGAMPPTLQYFLPHVIGPEPDAYFGVIGDPVSQSIGDVWHRETSLALDMETIGYLKIPLRLDESQVGLYFLMQLKLRGLSVTSPLKGRLLPSAIVTGGDERMVGNTLSDSEGGWHLSDTDMVGMDAVLAHLRKLGIDPGPVAVFGQGGVAASIDAALETGGWGPVTRISARQGWREIGRESFTLVINASGQTERAVPGAPRTRAWLDLHYTGTRPDLVRAEHYMGGRLFYAAQAMEQRRIWGLPVRTAVHPISASPHARQ